MTDGEVNPSMGWSPAARSLRTRALAGTALALVIGGATAIGGLTIGNHSALAAEIPDAQTQPTQDADLGDLFEKVSPAIVSIQAREAARPDATSSDRSGNEFAGSGDLPLAMRQFFNGLPFASQIDQELGSGFFISADGNVVTNNHVVDNAKDLIITTTDGTEYSARLIGKDERTDLAVLKVTSEKPFPFVKFSEEPVRVGQTIITIGNRSGSDKSVMTGVVSATGRESGTSDNYIQFAAPLNRGDSGGPTFNLKGEVTGINTSIYSPPGGDVGVAFAIPAATAEPVIASLKDHGSVVRAWLGVRIQPITSEIADSLRLGKTDGALVAHPQDNSPAAKAGIKDGDAILALDGKEVKDANDLATRVANYAPGTEITLSIWRDGEKKDLRVTLATLPEKDKQAAAEPATDVSPSALEEFGFSMLPSKADEGAVIAKVDPEGKAAAGGLQEGDVIISVENKKVSAPSDVAKQVDAARQSGLKAVLLQVKSGDDTRYVGLSFANA